MNTRDTILGYFEGLRKKEGWQEYFAEDTAFRSFGTPSKSITGRNEFLESTSGFYRMIVGQEVRDVIVDGDRVCVTSRYTLKPPVGPEFNSDVAEIFSVRDGKIHSLDIYFDSAPYPRRP